MNDKSVLEEYNKEKEQLLELLNNIKSERILPVKFGGKEYNEATIDQLTSNFEREEFTISVCGQMNAGKSTFLNHLLFRDKEVLPTNETPWTAKLTTVQYGVKDEAKVTFYDYQEWEKLKNQEVQDELNNVSTTYFEKYLLDDINEAARNGIFEQDYIKQQAYIKKDISLNELNDYVAKGGKFTAFVNKVDIKVNNPLTKGTIFVDTPGLNDHNTLRSKVTEEWINQSSAVIYLFYTGQAMGQADYEFIDNHLSSTPSSKILFVLTKADTSGDFEGAREYVEQSLKENEELKARKFLPEGKKVYPISTLSSLLSYKHKNNISFSNEEDYHFERIQDECKELLVEEGNFPELIEGIQEHLMKDKGRGILAKIKSSINDIYKTRLLSCESEIVMLSQKLDNVDLDVETLISKKEENIKVLEDLKELEKKYNFKMKELQKFLSNRLHEELGQLKDETIVETLKESRENYRKQRKISIYRIRAYALVKSNIEVSLRNIDAKIAGIGIHGTVSDFENKFSSDIGGILNKELKSTLEYSISTRFSIRNALDKLNLENLTAEKLIKSCGRYYFLFSDKDKIQAKIDGEITAAIDSYFNEQVISPFSKEIENNLDHFVRQTTQNLSWEGKKINRILKELLNNEQKKEEQVAMLKKELEGAIDKKKSVSLKHQKAKKQLR